MGENTDLLANEIGKMTTLEAKEVLKKAKVAIIPVGSTEQHSSNMTMNTDTILAEEVSKALSKKMYPDIIVLPAIPVGVSYHHMNFAGSMTLSPATLQSIIIDYIKSLKYHGLQSFILLNGHGGNQAPLSAIATMIRHELKVNIANLFYWNLAGEEINEKVKSERYGHACEVETSFGLYLNPSIVREKTLRPAHMLDYPMSYTENERGQHKVDYPYTFDQLTVDGSLGDARQATEELGKEIIEIILDRMERFMKDFIKY